MENEKIVKLFKDLFDGYPWLDASILGTLEGIPAQKAAAKPHSATNSIWEIVNHISSWRHVVLNRIHGSDRETPQHNYFLPVEDTSADAWKASVYKLGETQQDWLAFLSSATPEKLNEHYLDTHHTVYDLIFGIMQHDAYHLGQLALLSKYDL